MAEPSPPEWVASEQWLVFISDRPLVPGEVDQHGLREWWSDLRGRRLDDAKADFRRVFGQVEQLVKDLPPSIHGYGIEELEVGLAFTAEGQLAFIAKAGIEASVKVQFKRRSVPPPPTGN
jgi:hypothetical protein